MVVGGKILVQNGKLLRRERPLPQIVVDLLRSQLLNIPPDDLHKGVLGRLPRCLDTGQFQLVDGVLRRDVAGQIPCVRVQQRVHEGVVKHAVEHHVKIVPHDDLLLLLVAAQHPKRVVVDMRAVHREAAVHRHKIEPAQRHVQKTQVHQQRVARQLQGVLRQFIFLLLSVHRQSSLIQPSSSAI